MTNKQPEALRYADILEHKIPSIECLEKSAAELRRLHEAREACERQYQEKVEEVIRLHEINAELVEAAKLSLIAFKGHWNMDKTHRDRTAMDATIAALAKAQGENNGSN